MGELKKMENNTYIDPDIFLNEDESFSKENYLYKEFKENRTFSYDYYYSYLNIVIKKGTVIRKGTKLFRNVVIGENVTIREDCIIGNNSLIRDYVELGDRVKIGFCCSVEPHAKIEEGTSTQGFCMISEFSQIGKNCFLGPHFNSMGDNTIGKPKGEYKAEPPIIGDNCRFGSATKIVPNIKIADGTITGAMTLLTKDTEENTLYYGIPAKKIRKLPKDLSLD